MNITPDIIKEHYLALNPDYNVPERFSITVNEMFTKNKNVIPTVIKCIDKHKFSGQLNKFKNVGDIKLWKVIVYDTTLPGSAKGKPIDGIDICVSSIEEFIDLALFKEDLMEIQKASEAEHVRRSVTESTAERVFANTFSNNDQSVKAITLHVPLSLPTSEGTYSVADKEFFKWFARDSNNNIYMKLKDKKLLLVPMRESEEGQVRDLTTFWSSFWKTYRNEIIKVSDKIVSYAWTLRDSIEDAELDEERLRVKVDPKEKRSIMSMIHQFVPKLWMNRLCLNINIDQVEKKVEGEVVSEKYFKGFTIGFFPKGMVNGNPQPPTDENWQKMLSYAIPKIEISELEAIRNFTDQPNGLAIHRIQTGLWKQDLPTKITEVERLPPTWSMFFETRLGDQKVSMLYRIAKWLVGVVDATDTSRKVLVIAGHGADGKSLFQTTVLAGLNKLSNSKMCSILPAEAVTIEGNTQNGLVDCLDARVIMVPDVTKVTEFLRSDIVKGITGGDEITCSVKYQNPIKKSMLGTKMMLCTNSRTYMSDTFVESRVSPIYFERHDATPGDWNPQEIRAKLVDEFADFMKWCHHYAYAVECERSIPHSGDQAIWSDGVDQADTRETWSIIGRRDGDDTGMFAWHQADENAEIIEDDIMATCCEILYKAKNDRVECNKLRRAFAKAVGFGDIRGKSKQWRMICSKIAEWCPEAEKKKSNGIDFFYGIRLKEEPVQQSSRSGNNHSELETQLPY